MSETTGTSRTFAHGLTLATLSSNDRPPHIGRPHPGTSRFEDAAADDNDDPAASADRKAEREEEDEERSRLPPAASAEAKGLPAAARRAARPSRSAVARVALIAGGRPDPQGPEEAS
mmetsp:Transcript_54249/g.155958  ORF Transcript_54249/g.155958 Transcript_54249/m.155958 type:complete len:117 (+) Transcript_54249:1444-1794(+)